MRHWPAMLLPLLLAGCSCQRHPAGDEPAAPRIAPATDIATAAGEDADADARQQARDDGQAFTVATSTLHAYFPALLDSDRGKSDAFWSGGRAPPQPDDALVRGWRDVRSLRVQNDLGKALDDRHPPTAVEIPVRLTARTDSGVLQARGWYRLRPKVDGTGWEITSASLQPVLD